MLRHGSDFCFLLYARFCVSFLIVRNAPSFSFGSRTPAASIFGLPPPAEPKRRKHRKKKRRKSEMLGYNPFDRPKVRHTKLMLDATESVSSLSSARSDGALHRTSRTYMQQYRKSHRLSRPKYTKRLPTLDHAHFAKMGLMNGTKK